MYYVHCTIYNTHSYTMSVVYTIQYNLNFIIGEPGRNGFIGQKGDTGIQGLDAFLLVSLKY